MTSQIALWIVSALYLWTAVVAVWHGQWPQAVIVGGYVVANLGLIWSLR